MSGRSSSNISAEDETNNWYIEGGNSVLMEQYTATWCDVCAEIDTWIGDFADNRGSRLVRIALHDPIADPLGNSISSERLSISKNLSEFFKIFSLSGPSLFTVEYAYISKSDLL